MDTQLATSQNSIQSFYLSKCYDDSEVEWLFCRDSQTLLRL